MVRRINESVDLELDGYEEVSSPDIHYSVYRKVIRDSSGRIVKGVWAAWEIDRKTFKHTGEPFEITYDQACGFEPIKDTAASRLGRQVGKALKMSNVRGGTTNESRGRRTSRNSNRRFSESVSDKLEIKKLVDDINALNDDRSWVEIKASVEKRQSSEQHICKVIVINHFYTNVADEYRVLQSNRGGFVIHYNNPTGTEWKDSYNQVLDYFENMVLQNIDL